MSSEQVTGTRPPRVPLYNDPKVRSVVYQLALAAIIAFFVYGATTNAIGHLQRAHIASGFGFWNQTAGFDISQSLIFYEASASTYGTAFWVGLLNTLLVAALGIVLATVLGFVIGIARLSTNWIVSRAATGYVETIRNIPLLLQLLFWYNSVLKALPAIRDSFVFFGGGFYLNNRGFMVPKPDPRPGFGWVEIAFAIGIVGAVAFYSWARKRQMRTGQQAPVFWVGLGLIVGLPLVVLLLAGVPIHFESPQAGRFNITGGIDLQPEFVALLLGLSIYTAAFISEVVRAGILAVSQRAGRGVLFAGDETRTDVAADRGAAGDAGDHPAADQPVPEPDQELLAGGGDRLSRSGADLHRHRAQPDRPGGRGGGDHDAGLSVHQPDHVAAHEPLQPARRAGGTVRAPP